MFLFDVPLLQREVGCPEKVSSPKHSLCHTLPHNLVSKPNAASRSSRQRNKPRVVSVTVQRTPFCFLLFLQRARPRPLFPPPPCSFPPALAFQLLDEEMRWICPFPPLYMVQPRCCPPLRALASPRRPALNHKLRWAPSAAAANPHGPCQLHTLRLRCHHRASRGAHPGSLSLLLPLLPGLLQDQCLR